VQQNLFFTLFKDIESFNEVSIIEDPTKEERYGPEKWKRKLKRKILQSRKALNT